MKTNNVKPILIGMVSLLCSGLFVISCSEDSVAPVDKTQLKTSLDEANGLLTASTEGTAAGNYQRGSKTTLKNAVDIAQVVFDLPEASQATVTGANANLQAAITTFKGKLVTAIDPTNLVGHWTFDELTTAAAGTAVKDYSGNNRNGTMRAGHPGFNGGAAGVAPQLGTDRYGNAGKALRLNKGANVEIPYNAALNPAAISISVWVRLSEVRNNRFIGLHSWNGYKFEVQDGNRPFMTVNSTGNIYDRDAAVAIGQNAWYHLVATHTAGKMKFYINGVMVKEWSDVPNAARTLATPYNLVLGCDFPTDQYAATDANYDKDLKIPVAWGGYLNGTLDEVRIYKVALTDAQVTSIYDLEKPN
jgi:hypothetical protein